MILYKGVLLKGKMEGERRYYGSLLSSLKTQKSKSKKTKQNKTQRLRLAHGRPWLKFPSRTMNSFSTACCRKRLLDESACRVLERVNCSPKTVGKTCIHVDPD